MEPGLDRLRLAASLRELRSQSRLSTYELAERLGWSQSRVSRVERGTTAASLDDVAAWTRAVEAAPEVAADVMTQAEIAASQVRSWQAVHSEGLASSQREIARMNAAVTRHREFAPDVVPGLLQTPLYARRILEIADVSGRGRVPEAVAERMNRQALLYDPARSFEFILTEGTLRFRVGSSALMHGQAEKIISVMSLPNVSVLVVPFTATPAALFVSGFAIYDIPDDPVVLVELLNRELQFRNTWDLDLYAEAFDRLKGSAVSGEQAETLIRSTMIESV